MMVHKFTLIILLCELIGCFLSPDTTLAQSVINDSLLVIPTIDTIYKASADTIESDTLLKKDAHLKITDAPINITENDTSRLVLQWQNQKILHQKEIRYIIYKNAGEIFQFLPGVFYRNLGTPGQVAFTLNHGLTDNHYTVILDGRPLKDPHTNMIDLNIVPVEAIDHINIPSAVSSSLFHNAIEIKTERYSDDVPYSRVYMHKGPGEFTDTDVTFSQQVSEKMDAMLGVTLKGYSGPVAAESYEHHQGRIQLQYRYSPPMRILYSFLYNRIKLHPIGPKMLGGTYITPDARSRYTRFDHTFTLKRRLFDAHYQNFIFHLYYSSISNSWKDRTNLISTSGNYRYLGLALEIRHQMGKNRISLSSNVEFDMADDDAIGNRDQTLVTVTVADHLSLTNKITLHGKVYSLQNNRAMSLNWGTGASYDISDRWNAMLEMSTQTQYPGLSELYRGSDYYVGNSDLQPEKILNTNLNLHYRTKTSFLACAEIYNRQIQRMFEYHAVIDSLTTYINGTDRSIWGFYLRLDWMVFEKFGIGSHVNLSNADDNSSVEIPPMDFYGYIQYHNSFFKGDLKIALRTECRYWDHHWNYSIHPYKLPFSYEKVPQQWIFSITGFFEIMKNVNSFLSVENILNTEYEIVYGYPMNGRTFHYGLRWEFWE